MATMFYALGWVVVVTGAAWVGFALLLVRNAAITMTSAESAAQGAAILDKLLGCGHGLVMVSTGILLMAVGVGISRLDRVIHNTRGSFELSRWPEVDRAMYGGPSNSE